MYREFKNGYVEIYFEKKFKIGYSANEVYGGEVYRLVKLGCLRIGLNIF